MTLSVNRLEVDSPTQPLLLEDSTYDPSVVSNLMKQVQSKKMKKLEKAEKKRFTTCSGLADEASYFVGDGSSVGFSAFQGVASLVAATAGMILTGGISGIVGGVLNIWQAISIFKGAWKSHQNGQNCQALVSFVQAVCLTLVGVIMILVSVIAVSGFLAAIGAILSNPYLMPVFLLLLAFPTICHAKSLYSSAEKIFSRLEKGAEDPQELIEYLHELVPSKDLSPQEWTCSVMEKLSEKMGVKAAIETAGFIHSALGKKDDLSERIASCRKRVDKWKRDQVFRMMQLSLYCIIAPLRCVATFPIGKQAVKIVKAVSNFFFAVASLLACYMLYKMPYSGNVIRHVKRVNPLKLCNIDHAKEVAAAEEGVGNGA